MAERDPSKTAAAILALGAPEMSAEGEEPASGEQPLDTSMVASDLAADEFMEAVGVPAEKRGAAQAALRELILSLMPEA